MNRAHCKTIRAKLKKNGGPLATEAADCIDWLLAQFTEKPRGELDPRHKAIVLLFNKSRLNKPVRDRKEHTAFNAIKDLVTDQDIINCRRWLKQPEPKGFNKLLSPRKQTPITFMRDYVNQTELAEEWCQKNPPAPDPTATKFPEPKDWQAHAPGNLGHRSWSLVCRQYPEFAEQLHNQLNP